jgi:hypothetical protein
MRHRLNHGFTPFNALIQEFSEMTKQYPPEEGPTEASEFEALRESMVFEGSELTFTPRGSPDPQLMRLVRLLAQQAARECYEEYLRLAREKRREAPPRMNARQRRSTVPLCVRITRPRRHGH